MARILPRQAYATYGGQFPRSHPAAPNDAIVTGGLLAWWTMDVEDCNFVTARMLDRSGNNNPLTLNNLTAAALVDGQINKAMSFNGSTQYCQAAVSTQTAVVAYSVSAWFKTTGTGIQAIVNDRGSTGQGLNLWVDGDFGGTSGAPQWAVGGSGLEIGVKTTATFKDGFWHHIVGTWSAASGASIANSQFLIYVDGAKQATSNVSAGSATSPLSGNGGTFVGTQSGSDLFTGSLDDIRIYNRVLDQGEVLALYAAGLAGMGYWSGLGLLAPAPATSILAPQRTLVGVGT